MKEIGTLMEMTYIDYAKAVEGLGRYRPERADYYLFNGLIGEIGEYVQIPAKWARDDDRFVPASVISLTTDQRDRMADELGDVLWFWTAINNHKRLLEPHVVQTVISAVVPLRTPLCPIVEGKISNLMYTAARFVIKPVDGSAIKLLTDITEDAAIMGLTVGELMGMNIDKLNQRQSA